MHMFNIRCETWNSHWTYSSITGKENKVWDLIKATYYENALTEPYIDQTYKVGYTISIILDRSKCSDAEESKSYPRPHTLTHTHTHIHILLTRKYLHTRVQWGSIKAHARAFDAVPAGKSIMYVIFVFVFELVCVYARLWAKTKTYLIP